MDQQHACRLLHRLHEDLDLRGHGRVCEFERVEVQDRVQGPIRSTGPRADEYGEGV